MCIVCAEPTNHLDLEACVWLEETLKQFKRILLLISHSQVGDKSCSRSIAHVDANPATQLGLMQSAPVAFQSMLGNLCGMAVSNASKLSSVTQCRQR